MTKYFTGSGYSENIEDAKLSLCILFDGCGCMTYSILSNEGTNNKCGKCSNTK